MRVARILLLACLPVSFALAGAASAEDAESEETTASSPLPAREGRRDARSCRVIAKQIVHFEEVKERARERDNDAWEKGTEDHIDRLRVIQLRRCPDDVPPSQVERIADLLKKAGRIAATAASLGAF